MKSFRILNTALVLAAIMAVPASVAFAAQYCDKAGGTSCETFDENAIGQSLCMGATRNNPDACEMTLTGGDDFACAAKRVGVPTYTAQLTHFEDTQCARGACDQSNPGIAHRSWPIGSLVEVCKLGNGNPNSCKCATAIVMDRGPANYLGARTIDGNIALTQKLGLTGSDPAMYMLLKAPGVNKMVAGADDIVIQPVPGVQGSNGSSGASPFSGGNPNPGGFPPPSSIPPAPGQPQSGSPMANASPVPIGNQQQTPIPQTSNGTQNPAQQGLPGPSAGSILVQPPRTTHGRTVIVSWTSVNMSQSAPCEVLLNGQQFSQGTEGTKPYKTALSDMGTLTFSLHCTKSSGESLQSTASVTVL